MKYYNCGSGKPITIKELCKLIVKISNKNIVLKFNKNKPTIPFNLYLNCNKAKKELSWKSKTNINMGIKKLLIGGERMSTPSKLFGMVIQLTLLI